MTGTVLAGRYRIVGLLGRGGMGEVYRADDLMLAQPVALKFLPPGLSGDPARLARFREEVRTAREVSHPNVCRVYDIGEVAGDHFLSMEYVDGEDLSSLLRRIGRLPQDKGVEIARQLCAGLAAAHDRGVLHRDLKPANVMIDGRGHVRLADFGLARASADDGPVDMAGTPAYMAPEQFLGRPASIQSDIYALGLVLYEMFTGKPVVSGATVVEMARQHREQQPSSMTTLVTELDPAIEKAIQRCLEKNPGDRPASALTVAASLPGGDPLAAAMARGETPSPDLVAAAGDIGFLPPWLGVSLLAVVLAALAAIALLAPHVNAISLTPMPKPPDVLRDRARQVLQALGVRETGRHTASAFAYTRYLGYLGEQKTYGPDKLRAGRPPAVLFWYRESRTSLQSGDFFAVGRVTRSSPPPIVPGMCHVELDMFGRLRSFSLVPAEKDAATTPPAPAVDWSPLFKEAGFDQGAFAPADPQWRPPMYADTRAAWTGTYRESPGTKVRLEAAALNGRIVYFKMIEPWTQEKGTASNSGQWFSDIIVPIVFFCLLGGAVVLAVRNVGLGRGDRRGAFRVALFLAAVTFLAGVVGADVEATFNAIITLFFLALSRALLFAALLWVGYLALEPYVRRRWPQTLISWTRVLAGRWRDPLVGRDVLAGCALGVVAQALFSLSALVSHSPSGVELDGLGRFSSLLGVVFARTTESVALGTGILLGLFLATLLVRRRWIAITLVIVFFGLNAVGGDVSNIMMAVLSGGVVGLLLVGLVRLGLLTLVVSIFMTNVTGSLPIVLDTSVWYADVSLVTVTAVIGLAIAALWRAVPMRAMAAKFLAD